MNYIYVVEDNFTDDENVILSSDRIFSTRSEARLALRELCSICVPRCYRVARYKREGVVR